MWFIIAVFGFIGGYAAQKNNIKVSDFSFMVGSGAFTMSMIESMVRNGKGIMFVIPAIIALAMAILTITYFISFVKKL
jgi:hypothetical protein